MRTVYTYLKDLEVGDCFYAEIVINQADSANPQSKSASTTKIKNGDPVRRICVVLAKSQPNHFPASVQFTYLATFGYSAVFPRGLDKQMWYPFQPAPKEGRLEPLPALENGKAQWASLRTRLTITKDTVNKIVDLSVPAESVRLILGKMKA